MRNNRDYGTSTSGMQLWELLSCFGCVTTLFFAALSGFVYLIYLHIR